jgi:hypothetical protein
LQEAAKARREEMTKEDADYRIDKALSTGRIDKNGALVFSAKDFPANSSREQLIDHLTEEIAALGLALPRRIAEAKVDAALAAKADRRSGRIARVAPLGIPAAISLVSGRCGKPRACGRYGPIAHGASLDRFGPRVALGEAPAHEASLSFFGA